MEIDERHSRTVRIIGEDGLTKLVDSQVAVFGLGGVGSSCVEALARAGVGNFLVVDKDVVEPSNINRQAIAFMSTIGQNKVDAMEAMVLDINPHAEVKKFKTFVRKGNIDEIFRLDTEDTSAEGADAEHVSTKPDYIVDALDTLTAKTALALYSQSHGIPIISSMGGANKTDPTQLAFADLSETRICPLCREMRKIARKEGVLDFHVLYSTEKPVAVAADPTAERSEKTELGTMPYFPPIMGQMIAGYVIRELIG